MNPTRQFVAVNFRFTELLVVSRSLVVAHVVVEQNGRAGVYVEGTPNPETENDDLTFWCDDCALDGTWSLSLRAGLRSTGGLPPLTTDGREAFDVEVDGSSLGAWESVCRVWFPDA